LDLDLQRHLLAEARVGRLATVDAAGNPHVVPVCFVLEGEIIYWAVDHKPKASRRLGRLANLEANPVAQLVVDHYAEAWAELWWVRVSTEAQVLPPGVESERALVARLGGGCALPLGAYAEARAEGIRMLAVVIRPDGSDLVWAQAEAPTAEEVALEAGDILAAGGAREILAALNASAFEAGG
jgi:PPOX class probable F420-dependent enzyme